MDGLHWLLEVVLVGLLALTLVHAIRLERALGTLRRDRTALGEAVAGFDTSTRQAEAGLDKLHSMTQEAAHQVARKIEGASVLKEDLAFLSDRGEQLANRLEQLIRAGRLLDPARARDAAGGGVPPVSAGGAESDLPRPRSKAERDLLQALRVTR